MHSWKALFQAGMAPHGRGCCEGLLARSECRLIGENHDLGSFRPTCEKWEIKNHFGWVCFSLSCLGYRSGTSHRSLLCMCPCPWVSAALHASADGRFGCLSSCLVSFFHPGYSQWMCRQEPPPGRDEPASPCCLLLLPAKHRASLCRGLLSRSVTLKCPCWPLRAGGPGLSLCPLGDGEAKIGKLRSAGIPRPCLSYGSPSVRSGR